MKQLTIRDTKPKVDDEWHTEIGSCAVITQIQYDFYGSPDNFPVKGYTRGDYRPMAWTFSGVCSQDEQYNLVKLHHRTNATEDRRDHSLEFFHSVMDPNKPVKSIFDVMKEREANKKENEGVARFNSYGYVVECQCGCQHFEATTDGFTKCKYCGKRY
jgi:hypothetical protein